MGERDRSSESAVDGRGSGCNAPPRGLQDSQAARQLRAAAHARSQAHGHAYPRPGRDAALLPAVRAEPLARLGRARDARRPAVCEAGGLSVLRASAARGRGDGGHECRRGARAQDHEAAAQGQERHSAHAQAGAAPTHGQGARVWGGAALQPHPAAAHVAHARGPGAPPARQGDRPRAVQARRPGAPVRAQDPRRDRAVADRRGLLCARRRAGDHLEPLQGRRPRHHDRHDAPGYRQRGRVRAQHDGARILGGRVRARRARAAPLFTCRVPVQEELAGAPHGHQDRAADLDPARLLRAAAPAPARRDHRGWPAG